MAAPPYPPAGVDGALQGRLTPAVPFKASRSVPSALSIAATSRPPPSGRRRRPRRGGDRARARDAARGFERHRGREPALKHAVDAGGRIWRRSHILFAAGSVCEDLVLAMAPV